MISLPFGKPARDLTLKEAWELLVGLQGTGEVEILDPIKIDADENVATYQARQLNVRTLIAGVQFFQALGDNRGPNGSAGAWLNPSFSPTPTFAVVLHRLAKQLADEWGGGDEDRLGWDWPRPGGEGLPLDRPVR